MGRRGRPGSRGISLRERLLGSVCGRGTGSQRGQQRASEPGGLEEGQSRPRPPGPGCTQAWDSGWQRWEPQRPAALGRDSLLLGVSEHPGLPGPCCLSLSLERSVPLFPSHPQPVIPPQPPWTHSSPVSSQTHPRVLHTVSLSFTLNTRHLLTFVH